MTTSVQILPKSPVQAPRPGPLVVALVYDGLWFSPLKYALDAFIENTQEHVSGDIRMVLHGGVIDVNGRRSDSSLYDFNLATYDEGDTFDQSAARGFVQIHGLSSSIAARRDLEL